MVRISDTIRLIVGTSSEVATGSGTIPVHPMFFEVSFSLHFSLEELAWSPGYILDINVIRVIDEPDEIDFGFRELRIGQHHGGADTPLTSTKIFYGVFRPGSEVVNINKSNTVVVQNMPQGDLRCKAVVGIIPNTGNVLPVMKQSQEVRIDIPAS